MKAMLLAAGRGTRMGALTNTVPKPLLPVAGLPLIEYHLRALAAAGFRDVVINVAYMADAIVEAIGIGNQFGLDIQYSIERQGALETGGGIANALPLLGDDPFVVINSDIWTDFSYATLPGLLGDEEVHLVLVANPEHHPLGDFILDRNGRITANTSTADRAQDRRLSGQPSFTFSGIGVYRPSVFRDRDGAFPLAPILYELMAKKKLHGTVFEGYWWDVGTVDRLRCVEKFLSGK